MTLWYYAIAIEVVSISIMLFLLWIAPEMPNESHFDA